MKHIDILVQWKFLRRDEFEETGNCSSDNMELGKKHELVISLLTDIYYCNTTALQSGIGTIVLLSSVQ
jgi:hypothetical protein